MNQTITVENAIYEIGNLKDDMDDPWKCQQAKAMAIEALGKMQWIPVSERLPEEKTNPITWNAYKYPVTCKFGDEYDVRYFSFCRGHWYNDSPGELDDIVIAWMDRPEPYKIPERKKI